MRRLIVKKRGGGERVIPPHKFWINSNTPLGDDAEIWERMPHRGRRLVSWKDVIRFETVDPAASTVKG